MDSKWSGKGHIMRTADPIPRNNPRGPSFWRITLTPCRTPRYFFTPSFFACNSPCNCNLEEINAGYIIRRPRRSILESLPNLNGLETVGDSNSTACCDTSGEESPSSSKMLTQRVHCIRLPQSQIIIPSCSRHPVANVGLSASVTDESDGVDGNREETGGTTEAKNGTGPRLESAERTNAGGA